MKFAKFVQNLQIYRIITFVYFDERILLQNAVYIFFLSK